MSQAQEKVGEEEWSEIKSEADALWKAFATTIDQQLAPSSNEVQELTDKLYQSIAQFWTPSKYSFIGMAQLWSTTPEFQAFYTGYHPALLPHLSEAMHIYADTKLS